MVIIFAIIAIAAALIQTMLAPLTILGVMPLIALLIVAWMSYRYGTLLALPLMLLAGFTLSFFSLAPLLTILAYGVAGLLIIFGISASTYEDEMSVYGSVLVIALVSIGLLMVSDFTAFDSLNFASAMAYLLLTAGVTAVIWRLMLAVASPRQ